MDFDNIFVIFGALLIISIITVIVFSVVLVAGYIASRAGLHGMLWCAVTIVVSLFISGVLGLINRIAKQY